MEGITQIVSESLARHGFDRPLDFRRLRWSSWFRCESHHSLLIVPSKPGVFALAEEIVGVASEKHLWDRVSDPVGPSEARQKRMLAVIQFFATDDMAYVLDHMLSSQNPMRTRLLSGRYFVRFVVIEDEAQRHSICGALNQWVTGSGEKVSGIGAHFATSLEFNDIRVGTAALESLPRAQSRGPADSCRSPERSREGSSAVGANVAAADAPGSSATAPQLDPEAANMRCPAPFPSGF